MVQIYHTMDVSNSKNPILIVDDNPQYIMVLEKMFKAVFGYQDITSVQSIEAGYKELSSKPDHFKLLFVDFRFPGGETGGDLLNRLANEKLLEDKVAFLITSEPTADNVKDAQRAGAIGVVAKPFDREQLRKQLEKAQRAIETRSADSF